MVSISIQRNYIKDVRYFLSILFALPLMQVQAHPHSWIDLKTEIVGNETHIQGFKMSWTFDAMTSAYMLDGVDLSAKNRSKNLDNIASGLMENISTVNYFTYFYDGDSVIESAISERGVLTLNKTQLTLEFYLPLVKPQEISNRPMKLLVYETGYYTAMSWESENDIQLSAELSKHCSVSLILPTPTEEQFSYAMSLGLNEVPNYAQGKAFSQSVETICSK